MSHDNQVTEDHIGLSDARSRQWVLKTSYNPIAKNHQVHAVSITTEHQHIHEGSAYTVSEDINNVGNGASYSYLLKTPADVSIHFRKYLFNTETAPVEIYLYEDTTVSADGAAVTPLNSNRQSANTTSLSVFTGPTVTGVGNLIEFNHVPLISAGGGGMGGGAGGNSGDDVGEEWVLKKNTNYMLRVTNISGGTVDLSSYIFYYEE